MAWAPVSAQFANDPSATSVTITADGAWQTGDILYMVVRGWYTFADPRGFIDSAGSVNVPDNTGWRNANPAAAPPQSGYLGVTIGSGGHQGIAWVGCRVYAGEASFTVGYDEYSSAGPLLVGIVAFRSTSSDTLLAEIPSDITRDTAENGVDGVKVWDDSNQGLFDPDTHYWIESLWGPPTDLTRALGVQVFFLDVLNTNTTFGFSETPTETTLIDSSGMIEDMGGSRADYGDDPHPYVASLTFGYRLYDMPDYQTSGDGAPASALEAFGFTGQQWEGAGWTTILANGPAGTVTDEGGDQGFDEYWDVLFGTADDQDALTQHGETHETGAGDDVLGAWSYVYTNGVASTTWVIAHNLDGYPAVTIDDGTGAVIEGDVVYDSANQITVTFSSAQDGKAYLS